MSTIVKELLKWLLMTAILGGIGLIIFGLYKFIKSKING